MDDKTIAKKLKMSRKVDDAIEELMVRNECYLYEGRSARLEGHLDLFKLFRARMLREWTEVKYLHEYGCWCDIWCFRIRRIIN